MSRALETKGAEGYKLRSSLPQRLVLKRPCDESELRTIIDATYKQLLNRVPLENERLFEAESRLRNQDSDPAGFIADVAMADAFQSRLYAMAPLRAASAASLALLGRVASPAEVSRFLRVRAESGQPVAVREVLDRIVETDQVPRMDGMNTRGDVTQATQQRTAALYRGNAGLNPTIDSAI